MVCVTVWVKPGQGADFLEAARLNRENTRREPGNIRFDVLRGALSENANEAEPFFLFEVYRTAADFAAHQQTGHYFAFRDTVADMMAQPRQGVRYAPAFADSFVPADAA